MLNHDNTHICAITSADLDTIKTLLELILGDDLKSTHRLEVFARLAGYRTYAALRADLEDKIDIFGDLLPTPLYANPRKNDPFITSLPIEVRRRLAILEQIGILRMVAVALEMANDPVFGNIGIDRDDLRKIKRIASEGEFPRPDHRSSGFLPEGRLLLIVSPANLAELQAAARGDTDPAPVGSGPWYLAPVDLLPNARFFDTPDTDAVVALDRENLKDLPGLARDGILVFFSDEDRDSFAGFVKTHTGRVIDTRLMLSIKQEALEIEDETDGTFFEIGYHGTARNDLPEAPAEITGAFAVHWLSELANVVHGCDYEFRRMVIGDVA